MNTASSSGMFTSHHKDLNSLKWVQRRPSDQRLEHLSCGNRLRLGLVQPEEEKPLGRPFSTFQCLKGYKGDEEELLTRVWSDRTRGMALN